MFIGSLKKQGRLASLGLREKTPLLAMYLKSEGLNETDKQAVQDADDFADPYKESWKFDVEGLAKTQLDQTKWNAPQKTAARLECPERKPVTFKMERAC